MEVKDCAPVCSRVNRTGRVNVHGNGEDIGIAKSSVDGGPAFGSIGALENTLPERSSV